MGDGFARSVVAALLSAAAVSSFGDVSLDMVAEYDFAINGCGGITYAGGDLFYVLRDHASDVGEDGRAKVYPLHLGYDKSTGAITSQKLDSPITPGTLADSEGIAYDPGNGCLWISDEATPTIAEFYDYGMPTARSAPVPALQKSKKRGNRSLESLTISGDGLTMWTANEQALTCDGSASDGSTSVQTVVRLIRYDRPTVAGAWNESGQWAYKCDTCEGTTSSQSGLTGLCALPDGSLLTLEREVSINSSGRCRIYRLTKDAIAAATDVTGFNNGLTNGSYTAVSKGSYLLQIRDPDRKGKYDWNMIVYEGICLGPRLSNGDLAVYLVSDGGEVKEEFIFTAGTLPRLCALRLSGLDVRTVNFDKPSRGTAKYEGTNFRFLQGAQVTNPIDGLRVPEETAYTNRGDVATTDTASWSAGGATGGGAAMTFTVGGDMTASWTVVTDVSTNTASQLLANDSFEGYSVGAGASAIRGWTGDGEVVAATYAPPAVGYPLGRETHEKVMAIDGDVERTYDVDADKKATLDCMTCISRSNVMPKIADDAQAAFAVDADGYVCLYHRDGGGNAVWTRVSAKPFENGDWVRIGMEIDYASDTAGHHAYLRPRVNGELSNRGVASPLTGAAQGGAGRVRSLAVSGECRIDDVVIGASGWKQEGVVEGPSIPPEQGTITVEGDVATIAPAAGVRRVTVSDGEGLAKVVIPPQVEEIVGVPPDRIIVKFGGYVITGAFSITGSASGVTIALNPDGAVSLDGETVTVKPELSSVAGKQDEPLVVTSSTAAFGFKSIPGLIYQLRRGAAVDAVNDKVGDPAQAQQPRHYLLDGDRPAERAFYVIEVTQPER